METKEVKIGDRVITIKEMLGVELDQIDFTNSKEANKKQVMFSTGMSEDDYNKLTIKERFKLITEIVKINSVQDFTQPTKE